MENQKNDRIWGFSTISAEIVTSEVTLCGFAVCVHVELLLGDGELGPGVEDDPVRLPAPEMKSSFPAG